jgi:hypothetical protein
MRVKYCWVHDNKHRIALLTMWYPKSKYKVGCKATQTPDKNKGRISCEGVNILCWSVANALAPLVEINYIYEGCSEIIETLYLFGFLIDVFG